VTAGRDLVSPELRMRVFALDGFRCVAPQLGAEDACAGKWGERAVIIADMMDLSVLTLDHVRDVLKIGAAILKRGSSRRHRYRAPSDEGHLVTLCWHHHLDGWATGHRPRLREYLDSHRVSTPSGDLSTI